MPPDDDDVEDGRIQGYEAQPRVNGSTKAYLAVNGPRKEVTLGWSPAGVGERHYMTLSHDAGLVVYATETAEDPMTVSSWDDYDEENWAQRPTSVWVAGTQAGVRQLTMTFSAQNNMGPEPTQDWRGGESVATVTFTVCDCGLKSVTFADPAGGGYHAVYVDAGAAYGTPQWQDNSDSALNQGHLDGDAEDWDDDPADHQYPVCYESGSNLKVTVMFLADPQEDFEDATIEGDGPEGLDFSAEEADFVTIGDKDYARVEFESSAAFLASKVDWFPGMEIKWTLRSEGRVLVEKSVNEVFVTLVAPECDTLYRTVAYLACSNTGAEDEDVALAHTWNLFSTGTGPADVCGWNDATRGYDRDLHFWKVANTTESTTADLLSSANGNCDAWAHIFRDALRANGVTVNRVVVLPMDYVANHPEYTRLVVKNVEWDDADPEFPGDDPWKYGDDDIDKTPQGLPGQNMATPAEKIFWWHHVTVITYDPNTSTYYDPSYGIAAEDEEDFTQKAIAGWGLFRNGAMHYRNASSGDEVLFNGIQW